MKRVFFAAFACCCILAHAELKPPQAVGDAISERPDNNAKTSADTSNAKHVKLPTLDLPPLAQQSAQHAKRNPEEIKEGTKEQSQSSWGVTEWTAIFNAFCALVTAAFTAVLGRFTIKMAKSARDTATIAENSFNASLASTRAYVYATSARLIYPSMGENPTIDIVVRNYGKTPASIVSLQSRFLLDGQDSEKTTTLTLPAFYLSEGAGDSWRLKLEISTADANLIHEGKKSLVLCANIGYEDVGGARYEQSEVFIFSSDTPYGFLHERSPCAG